MSIKDKTIGPMMLSCHYWIFQDGTGRLLCADVIKKLFNIPNTATQLWITLTKHRPKHGDAIRVRYSYSGRVKLDNDTQDDYYIVMSLREEAADFGNDFYATIYYE